LFLVKLQYFYLFIGLLEMQDILNQKKNAGLYIILSSLKYKRRFFI